MQVQQENILRMWWAYHKTWAAEWWTAVKAGKTKDLLLSLGGSGIGGIYGWARGWITRGHFLEFMVVAIGGYLVLLLLTWVWHGLFIASKRYWQQENEICKLQTDLGKKTQEWIAAKQEVFDAQKEGLNTHEELVKALRDLAQAEKTIFNSSAAFHEQYAERVRLQRELAEKDKERELATLIPPANQPKVRLQARGITHIQYDHKAKMYTHLFDGTGNGFSIVIQIFNLAVRGASNKPIRVRAQAKYICDGVTTLLSPLVWLESPTSDIVLEPGETRELVIARKDMYGFWDFLTHGPHGNVSLSDGIDFDFEIELIDLQAGVVLDVEPSLYFHWHWREGPLTPSFYPITPSQKEIESESD
jgi:hypothetical protein